MSDVSIKHAQRRFSVHRDDAGVAHIRADTWLDTLYGLGYMHAVDRGTQLLFSRTIACGEAAGRIADKHELLETDRFFRRVGLHIGLDQEASALDEHTQREVLVYCAGVNSGIRAKGRSLPMWATGFQPDRWDIAAVILVGRLLSFGGLAVSQLQNERLLVELIHAGANDAALSEMFDPRLDNLDFDLIRQVTISNKMSDEALELLVDLPRLAGSNAWAVAPHRSATGHALLAADPHLEINRLPAIWYEAVLEWGDQYVMGATLPGFPLFSVGRTPQLSWGVTYIKGDTIDFFVEDCRPGGRTGWQYRREHDWHDFEVREEVITRKGVAEPEVIRVYENSVGTLDADPDDNGPGYVLSSAWVGRHVSSAQAITTWLDLIKAESVTAAMDVIVDCPQPTLCFILADREGHIGKQGCGSFPRRNSPTAGLAPLPAWDPENHWQGWLPPTYLPSVYDPPEGFVATANEEINPPAGPLLVTQPAHDYRLRRIRGRLGELTAATVIDMQQLQYDVVSLQARDLLEIILPHLPSGELRTTLAAWDCRYAPESTSAALFQQLYRHVMVEILGHERGIGWRRMLYLCSRAGFSAMILTAADRLLQKDQSWWWHGRDKGEMIRNAAARVDLTRKTTWAEVNYFHFANRFVGGRVGRLLGYDSRRHAMPGCLATPFQGHVFHTATRESTFAPSYHFVTDMGADEAWTNLPGGPSESRFSKYYRSDVPLWLEGEYKLLQAGR